MKLIVNEIFYSLQGEGGRTGEPSIFVRLTNCNLSCPFCDTDFHSGREMNLTELLNEIRPFPCQWIIWTGGEPALQLRNEHIRFFKNAGYRQAIETNGTLPLPTGIDYIACSPKGNYEDVGKLIPRVHEIRIPIRKGEPLPDISTLSAADNYFISPIFDGDTMNKENIDYCVALVKENSAWRLSLQIHKLIRIE
jgi:organic radical activating enzyme